MAFSNNCNFTFFGLRKRFFPTTTKATSASQTKKGAEAQTSISLHIPRSLFPSPLPSPNRPGLLHFRAHSQNVLPPQEMIYWNWCYIFFWFFQATRVKIQPFLSFCIICQGRREKRLTPQRWEAVRVFVGFFKKRRQHFLSEKRRLRILGVFLSMDPAFLPNPLALPIVFDIETLYLFLCVLELTHAQNRNPIKKTFRVRCAAWRNPFQSPIKHS